MAPWQNVTSGLRLCPRVTFCALYAHNVTRPPRDLGACDVLQARSGPISSMPVLTFADPAAHGRDHSHRSRSGASRIRSRRAGAPATTALAGTSFVTTVFVPTMQLSPTVTPRRMHAP